MTPRDNHTDSVPTDQETTTKHWPRYAATRHGRFLMLLSASRVQLIVQ
jgi:hypothetical protein